MLRSWPSLKHLYFMETENSLWGQVYINGKGANSYSRGAGPKLSRISSLSFLRGLPQSLQTNSNIVPRLNHDRFPPNVLTAFVIIPFDAIRSKISQKRSRSKQSIRNGRPSVPVLILLRQSMLNVGFGGKGRRYWVFGSMFSETYS
jgi:hypothetical protein